MSKVRLFATSAVVTETAKTPELLTVTSSEEVGTAAEFPLGLRRSNGLNAALAQLIAVMMNIPSVRPT